MPKMYCADSAEANATQGEYKLKACVNKMLRAEVKAKAEAKNSPK